MTLLEFWGKLSVRVLPRWGLLLTIWLFTMRSTLSPAVPMTQIEFILYPDGRVEERVTGVCGSDCKALTQAVEEKLGSVQATGPTQEQFQSTQIQQTVQGWS